MGAHPNGGTVAMAFFRVSLQPDAVVILNVSVGFLSFAVVQDLGNYAVRVYSQHRELFCHAYCTTRVETGPD